LKENYSKKTNEEISREIHRSKKAISFIAWKLGLLKDYETCCRSHKRNNLEITKSLLENLYFSEGKSIRKIAKTLGLGKNTVAYYFNKFKIRPRNISEANKNFYSRGGKIWKEGLTKENDSRIAFSFIKLKLAWDKKRTEKLSAIESKFGMPLKELIKSLYWNDKLTQRETAKKLGISREQVISLMKEFDIRKRPNYEHISSLKGEEHSMYGTKWEETYGLNRAKELRAQRSAWSRRNIVQRLANRKMPFKDTIIEKKIAKELATRNLSFIPQYAIDEKFVCDFALPDHKIIIECDGDYWHANPGIYNQAQLTKAQSRKVQTDRYKDEYLRRKGWRVMRFFESDINQDVKGCVDSIEEQIRKIKNPLETLMNPVQPASTDLNIKQN